MQFLGPGEGREGVHPGSRPPPLSVPRVPVGRAGHCSTQRGSCSAGAAAEGRGPGGRSSVLVKRLALFTPCRERWRGRLWLVGNARALWTLPQEVSGWRPSGTVARVPAGNVAQEGCRVGRASAAWKPVGKYPAGFLWLGGAQQESGPDSAGRPGSRCSLKPGKGCCPEVCPAEALPLPAALLRPLAPGCVVQSHDDAPEPSTVGGGVRAAWKQEAERDRDS
nr:uncharacterized protein LOC105862778 isoform X3 [Microcebus murinus]